MRKSRNARGGDPGVSIEMQVDTLERDFGALLNKLPENIMCAPPVSDELQTSLETFTKQWTSTVEELGNHIVVEDETDVRREPTRGGNQPAEGSPEVDFQTLSDIYYTKNRVSKIRKFRKYLKTIFPPQRADRQEAYDRKLLLGRSAVIGGVLVALIAIGILCTPVGWVMAAAAGVSGILGTIVWATHLITIRRLLIHQSLPDIVGMAMAEIVFLPELRYRQHQGSAMLLWMILNGWEKKTPSMDDKTYLTSMSDVMKMLIKGATATPQDVFIDLRAPTAMLSPIQKYVASRFIDYGLDDYNVSWEVDGWAAYYIHRAAIQSVHGLVLLRTGDDKMFVSKINPGLKSALSANRFLSLKAVCTRSMKKAFRQECPASVRYWDVGTDALVDSKRYRFISNNKPTFLMPKKSKENNKTSLPPLYDTPTRQLRMPHLNVNHKLPGFLEIWEPHRSGGGDKLTREQMLAQLRALRDKGVKLEKGWSKLRVDELRDLLRRAKKRKPQ